MKMEIKVDKKPVLFLAVLIVGLAIVGFVVAYTNPWGPGLPGDTSGPPVTGHSADEMNVYIGNTLKTLQQAIDAGDFGGATGLSCSVTTQDIAGEPAIVNCPAGTVITGGGVTCPGGNQVNFSHPEGNGWRASCDGFRAITVHAICCEGTSGGAPATVDCGDITGGSDPDYCADDVGTGNVVGGGTDSFHAMGGGFTCSFWGSASCAAGVTCNPPATRRTTSYVSAGGGDYDAYYICVT